MSDKQLWGAYVELEKERDMLRKEVASLRSGLQHEVDCVEACKEEIERLRRKINEQAEDIRELLAERDQLAAALEAAREDGACLRETLRDVTGVAICGLFDTHREDTLREFSLQELARVTEVTAPLMEEGVAVESVYRRGYDAAMRERLGEKE